MKIDIVITVYNRADTVNKAIYSALECPVNKVIVVDDASCDDTYLKLHDKFGQNPQILLIRHIENQGVTGAKNTGFNCSEADWVFFLDSDDEILTQHFHAAHKTLKNYMTNPIVFFRCIDENGDLVGTKFEQGRLIGLEEYIRHISYGEAFTAINKRIAPHAPYDQDLRGYEGIGCTRLIKQHGPAFLSNIGLRRYNQTENDRLSTPLNTILRSSLLAKGHLRFYREFKCDMPLNIQIKMLFKMSIYFSVALFLKATGLSKKI